MYMHPNHLNDELFNCKFVIPQRNDLILSKFGIIGDFREERKAFFNVTFVHETTCKFFFSNLDDCIMAYRKLSCSAEVFYDHILNNFIEVKTYKTFNVKQRSNFHGVMAELFSLDFYSRTGVLKTRKLLKSKAKHLGLHYYGRISKILNMIGWYGVDKFYEELINSGSRKNLDP